MLGQVAHSSRRSEAEPDGWGHDDGSRMVSAPKGSLRRDEPALLSVIVNPPFAGAKDGPPDLLFLGLTCLVREVGAKRRVRYAVGKSHDAEFGFNPVESLAAE